MTTKLHHTQIRLTDSAALNAMTAAFPDGDELRARLRRCDRVKAYRYYADIRTAFLIGADGTTAQCFKLTGITQLEAVRIAAAFSEIKKWSLESFQTIVEEVLGRVGIRVQ
jgi:hypothetical protein